MLLESLLIVPLPVLDHLLVEGVLDANSFPSMEWLEVLHYIRPADVKFVEFAVDMCHVEQR